MKINSDYKKSWVKVPWYSSYEGNNYGDFFYSLMRVYRPATVVELGTKAGYSAFHIARGLRANGKGTLDCYDLWQDYKFNSVAKTQAEKNLKEFSDIVHLNHQDAVGVEKKYRKVDILHVDLSNEGGILEKIVPFWIDRVNQIIIIEGGSKSRDNIEWMTEFKKKSIAKWLQDFSRKRGDIEYLLIDPFPSVTIIRKK